MDEQEIIAIFDRKKSDHNIDFNLKREQILAAKALLNHRHCICFLPTGFGKTLIHVVNSVVRDYPTITLVISPLLSLIEDQMANLKTWNFSCGHICSDTSAEEAAGIANGDFHYVFASPESIVKPKWRTMFLSDVWQERICCVVFDEAHCISEWGEEFRPDYRDMGQLRSFFDVPILALTATSTVAVKHDIASTLNLSETDTEIISRCPNRPNIFLQLKRKKSYEYEQELQWLIHYLKANGKKSKKILIYCRSIDTVSEIFIVMKDSLGEKAYINNVLTSENLIVEMFHKCTDNASKERILKSFSKNDSNIRCLIATVALGMGLNIPDIDLIIHIGCPKSIISYWQEAGRCARDSRKGFSLILFDNFTASLKTTDKNMSNLVRNTENKCIRQMILDHFTASETTKLQYQKCNGCKSDICSCDYCSCCSVCAQKCQCQLNVDFVQNFIAN